MFSFKRQSLVFQIALVASLVSMAIFAALIGFTSYFTERYALEKTEGHLEKPHPTHHLVKSCRPEPRNHLLR